MPLTKPLDDLGTCLVTGAAGFLGSHLVRGLLDEGYSVRAVIRNTPLELEHPNLEIARGELEDAPRMLELCQGIDTVFHTAAHLALLGGSAASAAYRQTAYDTNVGGVENLVAACHAQGVSRFVHTSSIDVCFNAEENVEMDSNTPIRYQHELPLYRDQDRRGESRPGSERRTGFIDDLSETRRNLRTRQQPHAGRDVRAGDQRAGSSRRLGSRARCTITFTSIIWCMRRSSPPST